MIKDLQRSAVFRNPTMAAAHLTDAQADAMKSAAKNEATGPMFAFAGMNMAAQAGGMNAANLFAMGAQQQPQTEQSAPAPAGWTCACGTTGNTGKFCRECGKPEPKPEPQGWTCACGTEGNTGKFCRECGKPKPQASPDGWTCACGAVNKGKFCAECGAKKPASDPLYKCDKCGWEPKDPNHPPKFCPECGDPFDDNDITNK